MNTASFTTLAVTFIALLAFAANSILCRLALRTEGVPPLDFTVLRILSAAVCLSALSLWQKRGLSRLNFTSGNWPATLSLLVYLGGFSFAYINLSTATGALLLFAAVQFTMLLVAWMQGRRMQAWERIGVLLSLTGFGYFVLPQLNTPDALSCIAMILAGGAWGVYSLLGASSRTPLADTTGNFLRLMPLAAGGLLIIWLGDGMHYSAAGLAYSLMSGALASGLGYALWYWVLPKLNKSVAAASQLSVPIWAALGGFLLLAEPLSGHLLWSSGLILGGIAVVLLNSKS